MKNLRLLSIVALFVSIAIIGCKKGDTGPAGPAGAAGAAGATGPAGPQNILYSAWTTLNTPLNTTDSLYEQSITATGLTADILNNGVVLSYIGISNGTDTAVFSLSEASSLVATVSQVLFVGEIDLYAAADYTGTLYRYVLIPGTILTNGIDGKIYTKQELQTMKFADVQKLLGTVAKKPASN